MTTKFEAKKTYSARSICDYDCIFSFEIIRRTAKSVWIKAHGEIIRRAIKIHGGVETIFPLGTYSMAPILRADRI